MPKSNELFQAARAVRERSHSPYSGHKVGAAIRTKSGKIYSGCNVENSSYGGTVCAERGAILKAVSEEGKIEITELLVVTDASPPWPPCGFCRQVIAEFAAPELNIVSMNLSGEEQSVKFLDLFPQAFTPSHLGK
ncbi:MAG: cytidine deaminase [Bdellovibrionales bacterium GWB1_55_8]|nr:MAG: cytidine deaminase [Bdellovibrionales bacterium GWB1_55_8]